MHKSRPKFISISSAHSQKNEIEKRSLITLKKCTIHTCRFEKATPMNVENMMIAAPPITGSGIAMKTAESFPIRPKKT